VQLVDIMPTILEVAGIAPEQWPDVEGVSLVDRAATARRPVIAEHMLADDQRAVFAEADPDFDFSVFYRRLRSIQVGRYKLIVSDRGEPELYDLDADPEETEDLTAAHPEIVSELAAELSKWVDARAAAAGSEAPEMDAETLENLRSLGYL
jgi:arylsulfatase A-like enzyme